MTVIDSLLSGVRPASKTQAWTSILFTIALALVMGIAFWTMMAFTPTGDIVWRLYVAEQLAQGKVIYQDVIETNPPLWFWAALPWHYVGQILGVEPYKVLIVGVMALAGAALWTLDSLTRDLLGRSERQILLLAMAVSYLIVPLGETGQREHAFMVASVLWTALAVARMEGKPISSRALLITLAFSAYGFALKHFFVLVPILIEGCMLARLRRAYRPIRFETLGLATAAILYALALFMFAQEFFARIVPMVMVAYANFGPVMQLAPSHRLGFILSSTSFALIPFGLALLAWDRRPLTLGLLVTLTGMLLAIWLQMKGWRYHMLAAQGVSLILVVMIGTRFVAERRWFVALMAALGLLLLSYQAIYRPIHRVILTKGQPVYPTLRKFVANEPQDARLAVLSISPEHAFYIVRILDRPIISRHYGMWMLVGLEAPQTDPAKDSYRQIELDRVRREYVADLTCRPPDAVVEEYGRVYANRLVSYNTLSFLREDPDFDAWFAKHYSFDKPLGYRQFVWRLRGERPKDRPCERNP